MVTSLSSWWALSPGEALRLVDATPQGLSSRQARERLITFGPNVSVSRRSFPRLRLALQQVRSPISLLLLFSALLSAWVGDPVEGSIILAILLVSSSLSYLQELRAHDAVQGLLAQLQHRSEVFREGSWVKIPIPEIVPGDIVSLSAGSQVPADCRILHATDLFVDQSALTGESFPSAKEDLVVSACSPLIQRIDGVFAGTHVISSRRTSFWRQTCFTRTNAWVDIKFFSI